MFSVTMDCIVSVHYSGSDFELDQCDVHRKKRHADEHEKELEYKIEFFVENGFKVTCYFIGQFILLLLF